MRWTGPLRVLEPNVDASLLHPLDLGRQLLSQATRLFNEFRRGGQGYGSQGVSHWVSGLHVEVPSVYGLSSLRLPGGKRPDGVHSFMLKALEAPISRERSPPPPPRYGRLQWVLSARP